MPDIRILHVDDEPDVRLLVEASLGLDPGLVTQSCASGTEALAIAAQWRPDLILLDSTMPDMDGPATLAELKDDPRTSGIRVIFLTASCQDSDLDRFKSIGSAGVIAKPFDPHALAAAVRSLAQPGGGEPTVAAPSHPILGSPAGAATDNPDPLGQGGDSMASGLGEAASATPGDAGAIVLFDANGRPVTLVLGGGWDPSPLGQGTVSTGPLGTPAAFVDGHDAVLASDWGAGTMPHAADLILLDLGTDPTGPVGGSLPAELSASPGAVGSGTDGPGDRASGSHAASDLVHASLAWQGSDTLAAGLAGSDIWSAGPSAIMLHEPRLLG